MSAMIVLGFLWQGATQEPATVAVSRERAPSYRLALAGCRDAAEMMERREWRLAEERLTEIISDPAIQHRECRLKIQNSDRTWTPSVDFFPVFARATARHELALECLERQDPFAAAPWVRGAAADVAESTAGHVQGSADLSSRIASTVRLVEARVVEGDGAGRQAMSIPRSHSARYRRVVEQVRASARALADGDSARALALATEACTDDEIPDGHVERFLLLHDGPQPELVEFRPLTARGEAALAHARTLRGVKAIETARIARDSFVQAVRRGTAALDGKIADAEALIVAAEDPGAPVVPVVPTVPKGAVWPALAMAGAVLLTTLVVLSRR